MESSPFGYSLSSLVKTVDGGQMLSIYAVDNDRAVIATLDIHGWEREGGWICWLFVEDKWRRMGVAKTLLLYAEKLAKEASKPALALTVFTENAAARKLYESIGYVVCWTTEKDTIHMSKHL